MAGLLILAVLAVGCSESSRVRAEVEATEGALDVFAASSPIDRFFLSHGGQEGAFEQWERQVWDDTVLCMRAEGFEMVVDIAPSSDRDVALTRLNEREWTEIYGYGLSDSFVEVLADQVGDPNEQIVAGLSDAEREEYLIALVGETLAATNGRPGQAPNLEDQGCSGFAVLANGGEDLIDGLAPFEAAYAEQIGQISSSAEMAVAEFEWSECMAAAGYPGYGHQDDVVADLQQRILAATDSFRRSLGPDDFRSLIGLSVTELTTLPGFPVAEFDAVTAWEIDVALTDLDCYEAHVAAVWEPLRNATEYALLDEFGDLLTEAQAVIGS